MRLRVLVEERQEEVIINHILSSTHRSRSIRGQAIRICVRDIWSGSRWGEGPASRNTGAGNFQHLPDHLSTSPRDDDVVHRLENIQAFVDVHQELVVVDPGDAGEDQMEQDHCAVEGVCSIVPPSFISVVMIVDGVDEWRTRFGCISDGETIRTASVCSSLQRPDTCKRAEVY